MCILHERWIVVVLVPAVTPSPQSISWYRVAALGEASIALILFIVHGTSTVSAAPENVAVPYSTVWPDIVA
jgi:hypothetical protein